MRTPHRGLAGLRGPRRRAPVDIARHRTSRAVGGRRRGGGGGATAPPPHTANGCVRPLSFFYSDASADGVEERSLVPRSRSHARLRRNATMSHAVPAARAKSAGATGRATNGTASAQGDLYLNTSSLQISASIHPNGSRDSTIASDRNAPSNSRRMVTATCYESAALAGMTGRGRGGAAARRPRAHCEPPPAPARALRRPRSPHRSTRTARLHTTITIRPHRM
ncbi:hypothetical protein EVAR_34471_1 [Eumeta japonica]|uniref:Uncharacterized protein n=1 Tax=Eumeta variegata TaxID=151549 RepID=A0A4C1WY10_EUMVA|nr:hypothetical protein EVAR_34471_1 [Eumeta japonica]